MAHLHKPKYTRAIPAGAEPVAVKEKPCVRWRGRKGLWVVAEVCADNPARCRVESGKWYVCYTDAAGVERDVPAYADRAASESKMGELVRTAARIASGLLPPEAASAPATLGQLLDEFERGIAAGGRGRRYAHDRALYARRVLDAAGVARVGDLTPARVTAAVARVRHDLGLSPLTAGYHVSAAKQFTRWLAVHRKSEPTDRLSALPCELDDTRPTFTRRALTPEDFARLLATARRSRDEDWGLSGRERAVLYAVAASTGLRANELANLAPAQFAVDADPPTVTARAAYAKGKRLDVLPLSAMDAHALAELAGLLRKRKPGEPVWPSRRKSKWAAWHLEAAQMLARDLEAAELPAADAAGAVFDFHSLRSQFATDMDRAGLGLATAQKAMRHSTPKLTSKHYTRRGASEMALEIAKVAEVRAEAGRKRGKETPARKRKGGRAVRFKD